MNITEFSRINRQIETSITLNINSYNCLVFLIEKIDLFTNQDDRAEIAINLLLHEFGEKLSKFKFNKKNKKIRIKLSEQQIILGIVMDEIKKTLANKESNGFFLSNLIEIATYLDKNITNSSFSLRDIS